MSGVPLRVVQILMAHKRIETTLRYFAPSRHPSSQGRGAPNRDSTWHYDWHRANRHGSKSRYRHKYFEMFGAQERTRTSTTVRPLAPEASASASSATWALRPTHSLYRLTVISVLSIFFFLPLNYE